MKKIIVFIFALKMIYSCGNKRGELIGVKEKKWFPEKPYGMTLVEGGAFIMGKQDDDIGQLKNAPWVSFAYAPRMAIAITPIIAYFA